MLEIEDIPERLNPCRGQVMRREGFAMPANALDNDQVAGAEVVQPGRVEGAHGSLFSIRSREQVGRAI